MLKSFFKNNKGSVFFIVGLLVVWFGVYLFKSDQTENYLKNPARGDIYIMTDDEVYAPMRIDSLGDSLIYMRNYLFLFSDAIPKKEQIKAAEFDTEFYAIYGHKELKKLYSEGNLVKIYRD